MGAFEGSKAPRDFHFDLHHPEVLFGQIVGEGRVEVIKETQRFDFERLQPFEQIVAGALLRTSARVGFFLQFGQLAMEGQTEANRGPIAFDEGRDRLGRERRGARLARRVDGGVGVQKRRAHEFGPGLVFELDERLELAQDMRVAEGVSDLVHPAIRQEVCSNFRSKGICTHSNLIKRADLEKTIGDAIRREWLNTATLEAMRAELIAERTNALGSSDADKAKLKAALGRAEAQSARIASAIAETGHNPALLAKLGALEGDATRLRHEMEAIDATIAPEPAAIASDVEFLLQTLRANIEGILGGAENGPDARLRETIRGMIDRIVVTPLDANTSSITVHGKFAGVMCAAGLLERYQPGQQKTPEGLASGASLSVVAGAGFEPAAFRL